MEGHVMGTFDQIGNVLGGALGQGQGGGVKAILIQQLIAMLSKPGALDKLIASFQSAGLGKILESWIGTGQNLPISADQVRAVLGSGTLTDLAQRAGIDEGETASTLSGLLPEVIDKVTPAGKVPGAGELGGLVSSLGKMFS
jgi:uncharacterized protein YidB (DUF937 family)